MMTAGAAYGAGIYASTNYNTSYGYSTRYTGGQLSWTKSMLNPYFIIGIVEIINTNSYRKDPNGNICVITDDNDILLRYMFVYNNSGYNNSA